MKPGRIAAWTIAAVAVPGLAACSGTSSGSSPAGSASSSAAGTSSPAQSQAGSQPANSQPAGQGQAAGSGSLTPPGAHLAFGGPATVGWVPPSQGTGTGAHHGIKLRVTVVSIDDRGQQQQSITFLGTFSRCDDPMPPKQFVSGKTYESCPAYLIPGGGSIQKVQWDNGPTAANEVTPYFDRPIVWG
jgi:hypothetical protein